LLLNQKSCAETLIKLLDSLGDKMKVESPGTQDGPSGIVEENRHVTPSMFHAHRADTLGGTVREQATLTPPESVTQQITSKRQRVGTGTAALGDMPQLSGSVFTPGESQTVSVAAEEITGGNVGVAGETYHELFC
jgi:hypothetical protein